MAKVEQAVLIAFGKALSDARIAKGWVHKNLHNQMQGGIDKSHLSSIENGKREGLNPVTVSRLVAALNMDKRWIDCFKTGAAIPPTVAARTVEESKQRAQTAERLEAKALSDPVVPPIAENLLKPSPLNLRVGNTVTFTPPTSPFGKRLRPPKTSANAVRCRQTIQAVS